MTLTVQKSLWTKDFCLASLVSFLVYIVFYSIFVVIVIHCVQDLGATSSQAGIAAGIFLVAALIARIFAGHYVERVGKLRMMLWGVFMYALTMAFYLLAQGIYLFFVIRFLQGLAFGFSATAISTLVANLVPPSRRSEGMGYYLLSITLASAVGPFIGIFIYQLMDFTALVYLSVGLAIASWLMSFAVRFQEMPVSTVDRVQGWRGFVEVRALPVAFITLLIYFCYSSVLSFFSAYAAEVQLMEPGKYFFVIYSLAIIASRPIVGKLADRRGINVVMYPSFGSFAIGLVLLSYARTGVMLLVSAVLLGFGFGTFAAMSQVLAIQKVERERFGVALSTVLSIGEMGTGFGPFVIGGLLLFIDFPALYQFMAVISLISMGLYLLGSRKDLI